MNRRTMITVGAGFLAVLALWWIMVFSPGRSEVSDVNSEVSAERDKQTQLEGQKRQLEAIKKQAPKIKAELSKLSKAVPSSPALAQFITDANRIAEQSQVKWVSVTPTQPGATGSASSIQLSIQVSGGFHQVLDYISRLEKLPRLVVVDGVQLDAAAAGGEGDGGSTTVTGEEPDELTVTLTARMFTSTGGAVVNATGEPGATGAPNSADAAATSGAS